MKLLRSEIGNEFQEARKNAELVLAMEDSDFSSAGNAPNVSSACLCARSITWLKYRPTSAKLPWKC